LESAGEAAHGADLSDHTQAGLRIQALGRVAVHIGPDALSGMWLEQRPGRLLRYLIAVRDRPASHEEIADHLWPHLGRRGPPTVRHTVHLLRRALGPMAAVVATTRGGYYLELSQIDLDVIAFEARVESGLAALAAGRPSDAGAELLEAVAMYRGDFLIEEPYADWAFGEREHLRARLEDALGALIELRRAAGDLRSAVEFAERIAALEPYDPDVQRDFIGLLVESGRRSRAMRTYEAYAARLEREFGEQPEFKLDELA
jgi:DNA-binding SARP family transcriptional activator